MDTSKEYIKMCEKAFRILPLWKPKEGDWYFDRRYNRISLVTKQDLLPENIGVFSEFRNDFTPLYRQDQLQEMVFLQVTTYRMLNNRTIELAEKFGKYCRNDAPYLMYTMEQLWLAFVMKEKYNKGWNGKNWEVINE